MVALIDLQPTIRKVLEKSNGDYRKAHELTKSGMISESLGMYLKELINMRSCCDIARLFAEKDDKRNMELRIQEAYNVLKEIYRVYSPSEFKSGLVELARVEFNQVYQEYKNLLIK